MKIPALANSSNPPANHYQQMGLLLTLYFAQGLPAGFITQALPAILRQYHVSLVAIGWSGLILVPWGIKFLWAPLVDSHYNVRWGRTRSWILPLQVLAIGLLVGVAFINPQTLQDNHAVLWLYATLFLLSVIGATQDIATDALATRLLKPERVETVSQNISITQKNITPIAAENTQITEKIQHKKQGQGNAIQVLGYRGGLIVGGGVLLMLLDKIGWQASFLMMAAMVFATTFPIFFHHEAAAILPNTSATITPKLSFITQPKAYIKHHYQYFWSSQEMRAWLGVLFTYKIAEGLSSGMVKPMMVDLGVNLHQIGFWATILGSGASLLGAVVAAYLMQYFSRFTALWLFNALQTLTIGLYGIAAYGFSQHWFSHFYGLFAINALEHFCASLALVAMLTTIMHYARPARAGSDFTIQVCLLIGLSDSGHFLSGYLAHTLGYTNLFLLSTVIGVMLLLPMFIWHRVEKLP